MTNKHQEATTDQLYFDGSAEPNPGGRMGAGWRLVFTDRPQVFGDFLMRQPQFIDDVAVMDDFLADVDRAVDHLERLLDDVDRAHDARAEAPQAGDQELLDADVREVGSGLRHQFTVSANFSFLRRSASGAAVGKERARSGNFT